MRSAVTDRCENHIEFFVEQGSGLNVGTSLMSDCLNDENVDKVLTSIQRYGVPSFPSRSVLTGLKELITWKKLPAQQHDKRPEWP